MSRYAIERYRPEYREQVTHLQRYLWGWSPHFRSAYLEWKHHRNPFTPGPLIYLALHGSRVVGMRSMFGACWEMGEAGGPLLIPCVSDSVIEPDHRDRGLFAELTDFAMADLAQRGYRHVLGLSATPANYVASIVTMGWRPVGPLTMLCRASSVGRLSRAVSRHKIAGGLLAFGQWLRASTGASGFSQLDRRGRLDPRDSKGPITVSAQPKPADMADLIDRLGSTRMIRHVRDETYFSWRFRSPLSTYRFLYWREPELQGYLVLRNPRGHSGVLLVDWEGTNPEVHRELLRAAVNWGRFRSVATWSATLPADRVAVLQESGFAPDPTVPRHSDRFFLRPVHNVDDEGSWQLCGRDLLKLESWDLRMLYSDAH